MNGTENVSYFRDMLPIGPAALIVSNRLTGFVSLIFPFCAANEKHLETRWEIMCAIFSSVFIT